MRVLFTSFAWPSHYFPMVPLAWACRTAGHEVMVAGQPALTETVLGSGLPMAVTGPDVDIEAVHRRERLAPVRIVRHRPHAPGEWSPERRARIQRGLAVYAAITDAMADGMIAFARRWRPDMIVHDPLTWAGPLAARVLGIPAVRHVWGADVTYQSRELETEVLAPVLARFGLGELDTVGPLTVDPCPPSMQIPSPIARQPVRYVPYSSFGRVPAEPPEPPAGRRICLTWGTSVARLNPEFAARLPYVLDALAALAAQIMLMIPAAQRGLVRELPAGARLVTGTPLHTLLPTCDAIVHQGGGGTLLNAVLAGVPQLVIPQLPDQNFSAGRLATTGAADQIIPAEVTAERIRERALRLLEDPAYRAAARRLRAEALAMPTPAEVAGTLAGLAEVGVGGQAEAGVADGPA